MVFDMEAQMSKLATCGWCLRFIRPETGYNPMIHTRYCTRDCWIADLRFRVYFSDENIGLMNYELYGFNNNPQKGGEGCGE